MGTTLVTCVGMNDPFGRPGAETETEGPILSVLRHLNEHGLRPDTVLLLATKSHHHPFPVGEDATTETTYYQEGMEDRAEEVKELLDKEYGDEVEVSVVELEINPAELDEVITATLESLQTGLHDSDEVHINVSSGTQAMSAAMTFLADSGYIPNPRVWQSLDPTKLPIGATRVKQVNLGHLSERTRVDRAINLVRSMAFRQAIDAFGQIAGHSIIPDRRPRAQAAQTLLRAYHLWDRAEFEQAKRKFEEARSAFQGVGVWDGIPRLESQLQELEELASDMDNASRETIAVLRDLFASITRRREAQNFLNMATRGRRLYEGVLNYWLYEGGLDPRSIRPSQLQDLKQQLRADIEGALDRHHKNWRQLGKKHGFGLRDLNVKSRLCRIMADRGALPNVKGDDIAEVEKHYLKIDSIRNEAYENHGLDAVWKPEADQVATRAAQILSVVMGRTEKESDLVETPFGARAILDVADALETHL